METIAELLKDVLIHRSTLLNAYIRYIDGLDTKDVGNWALIVEKAREAGLGKEQLCKELSCAWSTVLRWEAGETAPGSFAREAIKARFLSMLNSLSEKNTTDLLRKAKGKKSSRVTWKRKHASLSGCRQKEKMPTS